MKHSRASMAESYERLLRSCGYLEEQGESFLSRELPHELVLQAYFQAALLGDTWQSTEGQQVRIVEFGEWNRGAGPDFLRACVEIDGQLRHGDIELDPRPEDWELHGHGSNENFDRVVLHVCASPAQGAWFTRNSKHQMVPMIILSASVLSEVMKRPRPEPKARVGACQHPLATMPSERIDEFLQSAAAYRQQRKRQQFQRYQEALGSDQAWFEAFAEVLGYRVNKEVMSQLARRAPLASLGNQAESLLLGVAGFLVPVLPSTCEEETRLYHRHIWDEWWACREERAIAPERQLHWQFAGIRPANHPHRRVAALAMIASRWKEIRPLLDYAHQKALHEFFSSLQHSYWSNHVSLPSAPLKKSLALVGTERIQDFITNYILPQEESPSAWQAYLTLRAKAPSHKVAYVAEALFGNQMETKPYLRHLYQHQALIQIFDDFCICSSCSQCPLLKRLERESI